MAYEAALNGLKTGIRGEGDAIMDYGGVVAERSKIEEKIGLSLAKDSRVTTFASEIMRISGVKSYEALKEKERNTAANDKVDGEVDTFGGARAYKQNWGTLGSSVFAVMNEIEKDKSTKDHYSTVAKDARHPYFTAGKKKPEFDQPMNELPYAVLPLEAQEYLSKKAMNLDKALPYAPSFNYDLLDPKARFSILKDYRFASKAAKNTAGKLQGKVTEEDITNIRNWEPKDRAKDFQENPRFGAIFDNVVDKHSSGDNTNLVKRNGDGGVKDQWIEDAVKTGKPIISGPSGHTLRYLNFWKEKMQEKEETTPTLEAARLVMMANLMPPKHHSYDEIMVSSMAVGLDYKHRSSYQDLDEQNGDAKEPAEKAYLLSGASEETYSNTQSTQGKLSELDTNLETVLDGRVNRNANIERAIALLKKANISEDVIEVLEKQKTLMKSSS